MRIRQIKSEEIILLTDFLYEAIFQNDLSKPIARTVIQEPSIWKYIDRFGNLEDDYCLVAEVDNYIIGAVWVRCIHGFGYISEDTPEFAISIYPEYRGKGIGHNLMKEMLNYLNGKTYKAASLSVNKDNYAVRMYTNLGFEIIDEDEQEFIMMYQF